MKFDGDSIEEFCRLKADCKLVVFIEIDRLCDVEFDSFSLELRVSLLVIL